MLTDKLKADINDSAVFILSLPKCESDFREEAAELLDYAIELGKHIMVWQLPDRPQWLPPQLKEGGYSDFTITVGEMETFGKAMLEYLEVTPGDTITIKDSQY